MKKLSALLLLLALTRIEAREKKIELQDIEEDNLKSENAKEQEKNNPKQDRIQLTPYQLEYLRKAVLQKYQSTLPTPHIVPQYTQEEQPLLASQYTPGSLLLNYLSQMPMQIVYVPQVNQQESISSTANAQPQIQYITNTIKSPALMYQSIADDQSNYVIDPNALKYYTQLQEYRTLQDQQQQYQSLQNQPHQYQSLRNQPHQYQSAQSQQQYQPQIAYVTYSPQPTIAATTTIPLAMQAIAATPFTPISVPVLAATPSHRLFYPITQKSEESAPQKVYEKQKEVTAAPSELRTLEETKPVTEETQAPENPQPTSVPLTYEYHSSQYVTPKINPNLKTIYRPKLNNYEKSFPKDYILKRKPSLLDSYVPSAMQIEYMKRGYGSDPLKVYDTMRGVMESMKGAYRSPTVRHFERGFLPNQMYPTAGGGIAYGHFRRNVLRPTAKTLLSNSQ